MSALYTLRDYSFLLLIANALLSLSKYILQRRIPPDPFVYC